ncbi:LysR family transcriptional regulator [Streptomyces sp. J2-1]|uniref:LysR family transcriptional regulator n=1 Tax=Streptomyces corallincola TaxID=2851888 RepID=UPI001C38EECF|nr:LysR family transcriptional regulator [Streptomyces corallincola]MBV2354165.1 LysR family transcriptional regulator [Streptomyces corallincola]
MELEIRHLRMVCAVAEHGSLHKAARQLSQTQPSLSSQLVRIERLLGGRLFHRERTGCRPTRLGRAVLARARPLIADMGTLVLEARAEADQSAELRVGATASPALPGWMRRLRGATEIPSRPTLQIDVSANTLLGMVAEDQLDIAFVHEVEDSPLRMPQGLVSRVLVEREPQCIALPRDHPAASASEVKLVDVAEDRWMIDSTVDGEWDAVHRMLRRAGLAPRVVHGDYLTTTTLVASGEVVTVCQPTARDRADVAVRPLAGDPLGVRLLIAARSESELDAVYGPLVTSYREIVRRSPEERRVAAGV